MIRQARRKVRGSSQKGRSDQAVSAGSQVVAGGRFRPLPDNDLVLIVDKTFSSLENIGIAGPAAQALDAKSSDFRESRLSDLREFLWELEGCRPGRDVGVNRLDETTAPDNRISPWH